MVDSATIQQLEKIVGKERVFNSKVSLESYSYDATLIYGTPEVIVFPSNAEEVSRIVRLANEKGIPVVPRGAGMGLSGGTVPNKGGIVVVLTKMNRILEIDPENRYCVAEPGVTNMEIQKAVAPYGMMYVPDPASQKVSTIAGNVGENAGGMRGIKYGITKDHIIGLEVVLPTGEIVTFGGVTAEICPELDLTAIMVGAEGTLGIVTKVYCKLTPLQEAVKTMLAIYEEIEDAGRSVSQIIARGIIPTTLEMMDNKVIQAVEDFVHIGLPRDAGAVLLIEVDGLSIGLDRQAEEIVKICKENKARDVRLAKDAVERDGLWKGRRTAIGAIARLRPSYDLEDATVPRNRLTEMLHFVSEISEKYNLPIGMLAHAGDGNLHPLILFDERDEDEMHRVHESRGEIFRKALDLGGTLSGEHGIGLGKLQFVSWAFSPEDIAASQRLKKAFDPNYILNAGKQVPEPESAAD